MSDIPSGAWIGFGIIAMMLLLLVAFGIYATCIDPYGWGSRRK